MIRATTIAVALLVVVSIAASRPPAGSWRDDPGWSSGKAEWALYEASRDIYGRPRAYEATIFTNTQHMDRETTVKADQWEAPTAFPVFKHNVSEMVPTENYTYRFLTTSFVDVETLETYKVVASTQEDCGSSFRRFVVDDGEVEAREFCYFPDGGERAESYRVPGNPANFTFHDSLTLRLRDYPFDASTKPVMKLKLIGDQTNPRTTELRPEEAEVIYVGRETVNVPYGSVDTHHLKVTHARTGGVTESNYWFAADPEMRHVLAQYDGPWGVKYALKRLEWWAYWGEPRP